MNLRIQLAREDDRRWIAKIVELAGVVTCGASRDEALTKVQALALGVVDERLDHGER